jgi:hypothetical protein
MAQMVGAELQLEAVCRVPPRGGFDDAGVGQQRIDPLQARQ